MARHNGPVIDPTAPVLSTPVDPGAPKGFDPALRVRPEDESVAPKLIACDMDGTLLDHTGGAVSRRNAEALARASAAGAKVVIATGRPIWWLDPVVEAGFTGQAICMNGAIVYDIAAGEVLSSSPLTSDVMTSFVTGLSNHQPDFSLAVERLGTTIDSCYAEPDYEHPWIFGSFQRIGRPHLLAEPAAKMLVRSRTDSRTLAEAATAAGNGEVSITWSTDDGLIEVASAGVNKGSTLSRLAHQWGIASHEVIAFGDMPNDLEMLAWAGRGIAMGGGHPAAQAVASEVGPAHDDDGVARVLERWF